MTNHLTGEKARRIERNPDTCPNHERQQKLVEKKNHSPRPAISESSLMPEQTNKDLPDCSDEVEGLVVDVGDGVGREINTEDEEV